MFLIYERVWIQNIRNNMYTGLFLYRMILKYKNRCTYIQAQLQCIISKVPLVHMLIWAMASENFMHLKHKGNSPPFQSIALSARNLSISIKCLPSPNSKIWISILNSDQDFASETNLKSKIVGSLKRLIFYRNTMIYNIEI